MFDGRLVPESHLGKLLIQWEQRVIEDLDLLVRPGPVRDCRVELLGQESQVSDGLHCGIPMASGRGPRICGVRSPKLRRGDSFGTVGQPPKLLPVVRENMLDREGGVDGDRLHLSREIGIVEPPQDVGEFQTPEGLVSVRAVPGVSEGLVGWPFDGLPGLALQLRDQALGGHPVATQVLREGEEDPVVVLGRVVADGAAEEVGFEGDRDRLPLRV